MRWPFHFGKAARAENDAAREPVAPPRLRDWASLAPMQGAVGDAPLTAQSLEFSRSLAGSEEPPLRLETLGHHRSSDGPQGLVTGIANPIETHAPTTELIGRPRRRPEAPASVQAMSEEFAGAVEDGAGPAAALNDSEQDLPARALPAVGGEVSSPRPPVSRLTDATAVEVGPLRPLPRSPETSTQAPPTEAATTPAGNQSPAAPPPGTRLNLGLSRRHGLGAPIRAAETAAAQESMTSPQAPIDSLPPRPPPAQGPATTGEAEAASQISQASLQPAPDDDAPRIPSFHEGPGALPAVRRQSSGSRRSGEFESTIAAEAAGPSDEMALPIPGLHGQAWPSLEIGPSFRAAPVSIQRLAGSEPSRTGARATRSAPGSDGTPSTVPLTSLRPPLTSIRRPGESPLVSLPESQTPSSFAAFGEMPQPTTQKAPALTWNPSGAPAGASTPHVSRAAEPSPLVWNVQRMGPGETPASNPTGEAAPSGGGPSAGAPMMAAAPPTAPAAGAAQSAEGAGAPHPGDASPGGGGSAGPGGGTPAGGAAPHGEKELYELAQSLFDPLMSLFRREILTERERAGFITDLR